MKQLRQKYTVRQLLEYEERYFRYHWRRIPLDTLGNEVCRRIQRHFSKDTRYVSQALWLYHCANRMFLKTLELSKYPWQSRERIIHARDLQALKGFMLKDLIEWEKTG